MPFRMHSEYLRTLFLNNDLAEGRFKVNGRRIALQDIRLPVFVVGAERDHVSPWRSVFKIHYLTGADITFALANGGHNRGIVAPPGEKGRYFRISTTAAMDRRPDPHAWAASARRYEHSWWLAWFDWLSAADQQSTHRTQSRVRVTQALDRYGKPQGFPVKHPRWEPYAGIPPVRFCAGGRRFADVLADACALGSWSFGASLSTAGPSGPMRSSMVRAKLQIHSAAAAEARKFGICGSHCPSVLNLRKSRSLASGPPPAAINSATTFRPNRRRGLRVRCGGRRHVASVARSGAAVSEKCSDTSIMPPSRCPRGRVGRVGSTSPSGVSFWCARAGARCLLIDQFGQGSSAF